MRIAGNYTFEATRDEVWTALNDPEVLARTIPGCQRLEQVGEAEYESTLKVGLQAVRGTYHGRVKIVDQKPPLSYRIIVDGKGSNGFLKGEGTIGLRQDGHTTVLDYGGEAQVGGTIASVGQRLLDGAARTLINQSLKALAAQIESRRNGGVTAPEAPSEPASPTTAPTPAATAVAETAVEPPAPGVASVAAPPEAVAAGEPVAAAPLPEPAPSPAFTPAAQATFERRSIVVPPHEQLTEGDVARGVIEDFLRERPWFPWVVVAFLIGYILGRRDW